MTNEIQTKQFTCFNCGAKVDEAKRWYHADQDDMVCLACAEELKHTDTAYAGTSVAKMEVEKIEEKELILKELNCKRINLEDELRSIKEKIKEQSK